MTITIQAPTIKPDSLADYASLVELSHEYVRLHLIEELPLANELSKNLQGLQKLTVWKNHRDGIMRRILMHENFVVGKKYDWYDDWPVRLQIFQDQQTFYLNELIEAHYDWRRRNNDAGSSSSPWPRVTFDVDKSRTILHLESREKVEKKNLDLVDPVVTDEDVERVLRFHRPSADKDESNDRRASTKSNDIFGSQMMNRERYRSQIQKYNVIDRQVIAKLSKTYYELLRQSLKGKRSSILDYQRRLFQAERVLVQFQIWKRSDLFDHRRSNDDQKIPPLLRVLENDEAYRLYLNLDERFFPGNTMYGYADRYDDPSRHGLNFEVNSERVLGKRFKPMLEIYEDLRDLTMTTNDFKSCVLDDLPQIDLLLERYKFRAFWSQQHRFVPNHWFVSPESLHDSQKKVYAIVPIINDEDAVKNHDKPKRMLKRVNKILEEEKKIQKFQQQAMVVARGKHVQSTSFKAQLSRDELIIHELFGYRTKRHVNFLMNRAVHYLNSLNNVNALMSLTQTITYERGSKSHVSLLPSSSSSNGNKKSRSFFAKIKGKFFNGDENKRRQRDEKKEIKSNVDAETLLEKQVLDTLNVDKNPLMIKEESLIQDLRNSIDSSGDDSLNRMNGRRHLTTSNGGDDGESSGHNVLDNNSKLRVKFKHH